MYFTGATAVLERAPSVSGSKARRRTAPWLWCLTGRSGPETGSGSSDCTDGGVREGAQVLGHSPLKAIRCLFSADSVSPRGPFAQQEV